MNHKKQAKKFLKDIGEFPIDIAQAKATVALAHAVMALVEQNEPAYEPFITPAVGDYNESWTEG